MATHLSARSGVDAEHQRISSRDRRWWIALVAVVVASFTVLLYMGQQINQAKPPIPATVKLSLIHI